MIAAYLFTFFLFVLLVLFVLLPFVQQDKSTAGKSTSDAASTIDAAEDLAVDFAHGDDATDGRIDGDENVAPAVKQRADYDIEIEVAVAKARRDKSTFWNCSECGRRMKDADQFCASCGKSRK